MLLLLILTLMLLMLVVFAIFAISIGGVAAIIIFGDVIVCGFIVAWVIKRLVQKKKK